MNAKDKKNGSNTLATFLWVSLGITSICVVYGYFMKDLSNSSIFGDSFGALAAWFSGLAFAGIILTILQQKEELGLQRRELKLTRKELKLSRREFATQNETLKKQRFETTFFNLLSQHNQIVRDIYFHEPGPVDMRAVSGTNAFKAAWALLQGHAANYLPNFQQEQGMNVDRTVISLSKLQREQFISKATQEWYRNNSHNLNLYFLSIKRVLKLITRTQLLDGEVERRFYASMMKDQLTFQERMVMLYSLMMPDTWLKGVGYYIKFYSFLDGLATESMITPFDKQMFDEWADSQEPAE